MFQPRHNKPGVEAWAALAGTFFSALLLVLTAVYAGPLWRDEVNTANLARMPFHEMWRNLQFESFPPVWPLLLHAANLFGLADTDGGIRSLGLCAGFCVLASFWGCSQWLGCRAPSLSLALVAFLPAFVFVMGENRAYGLASCLLVLSFGTIWRVVEAPSRGRILAAGVTCLLFVHCVYFDAVFLAAMLAGGAGVALRHRQWRTLFALLGVGVVSAVTMTVYLPVIRRGFSNMVVATWPYLNPLVLWCKLGEAVTARSSAQAGHPGLEIWGWIILLAGGLGVAAVWLRAGTGAPSNPEVRRRADLALFCATSMVLGVLGLLLFLFSMRILLQRWHFIQMLCLCGIAMDGILGQPARRHGGGGCCAHSSWSE